MGKVEMELSEYEALKNAKIKAENDLQEAKVKSENDIKELKSLHSERVSEYKNTIKDLENKSRVIVKHTDRYFYTNQIDEEKFNNILKECTNTNSSVYLDIWNIIRSSSYNSNYKTIYDIVSTILYELQDSKFVEASEKMIPLFSKNGEPDQYIGFDDIKLKIENELKDQYINNQKKIEENLEQQIKKYEEKYQNVNEEYQLKYDEKIKTLENKFDSKQQEVDNLKESHKEEVDKLNETIDKLNEELREAQKTQEQKILDAEEKLREAQEVLKKLTAIPRKKRFQFWK